MRELYKIALFVLIASNCFGQNLVPNPSFEDTLYCPQYMGYMGPISAWKSFGNTPDCFHECSALNIPNSPVGYQYAHSGKSMSGIVTYVWQGSPSWPNYREYLGAQLLSPLTIGQKYFVTMFVNCAGYLPGWQKIGSNKTGIRFSTVPYDSATATIPDNYSHVHTDSILIDTVQWYKISGSFIADSNYQYIVIGNFL